MPGLPWTDAETDELRELHMQGLSVAEVSHRMSRPVSTVAARAKRLKLEWSGSARTANAIKAHKERARTLRGELEASTLTAAEKLREQLFAPTTAYNFGGKDNTYNEHEQPEPSHADKAKLAQAITGLINASVKLSEHDADYSVSGAKSMLARLGEQLGLGSAE